jgi:hypothetical protein
MLHKIGYNIAIRNGGHASAIWIVFDVRGMFPIYLIFGVTFKGTSPFIVIYGG